jgi:two-component system, LytTR family, sensor histidine kinase AlgZ
MISIKQNALQTATEFKAPSSRLPDLRNLGVCLRILVIVNLLGLLAAILLSDTLWQVPEQLSALSVSIQPVLLLGLLLVYLAYPILKQFPYRWGVVTILVTLLLLVWALHGIATYLTSDMLAPALDKALVLTALVTLLLVGYFNLRQRALSPAISEARLQALQARIRPHFLFNSINAVLSIIRTDPKRAETALEDMADLFRVVMADNRELVPLAQELALSRQYLALEKLRLEERLEIAWDIENVPPDALIPPLLLQPLLENAVYHGIEPMPEGGTVTIMIAADSKHIRITLSNPVAGTRQQSGNKMALNNIRERLALHFDVEATLNSHHEAGQYRVEIVIPYRNPQQ